MFSVRKIISQLIVQLGMMLLMEAKRTEARLMTSLVLETLSY